MMRAQAHFELENSTHGEESKKANAAPGNTKALARIWKRMVTIAMRDWALVVSSMSCVKLLRYYDGHAAACPATVMVLEIQCIT